MFMCIILVENTLNVKIISHTNLQIFSLNNYAIRVISFLFFLTLFPTKIFLVRVTFSVSNLFQNYVMYFNCSIGYFQENHFKEYIWHANIFDSKTLTRVLLSKVIRHHVESKNHSLSINLSQCSILLKNTLIKIFSSNELIKNSLYLQFRNAIKRNKRYNKRNEYINKLKIKKIFRIIYDRRQREVSCRERNIC